MAVHRGPPVSSEASASLRQWWSVITRALLAGFFLQAVFAGAILSAAGWARTAHWVTAVVLLVSTIAAGLVASITLRRIARGAKLGRVLLGLASVALLQTAVGKMTANGGANLMWLHVPLGVALVAFAARALADARSLGGERKSAKSAS